VKIEQGKLIKPGSSGAYKSPLLRHRHPSTPSLTGSNTERTFERKCCKKKKLTDHTKPEWSLGYEWVKHDFKVPGLGKNSGPDVMSEEQEVSMRKIKDLRRK
jgi:hypothetical protein